VIQAGDILMGETVESVEFFRGLNDSGQVAFTAFSRSGAVISVFRADPVHSR
jgi:hypothetical protein